jgi:hypothetical protein
MALRAFNIGQRHHLDRVSIAADKGFGLEHFGKILYAASTPTLTIVDKVQVTTNPAKSRIAVARRLRFHNNAWPT